MKKFLLLLLVLTATIAPSFAHAQAEDDYRLMLEKVKLLTETDIEEAFKMIDKLKAKRPNDPRLMAVEAAANMRIGNVNRAEVLLERAHKLSPRNEDIALQLKDLRKDRSPFVSVDGSFRSTSKSAREKLARLSAQAEVSPGISGGLVLDHDHITATEPMIYSDGTTQRPNEDRQRLEAYASFYQDNGDWLKTSFFLADDVVGAGAQYQWIDIDGNTTLEGYLQRPNWEDFIISTLDGGTKDGIKLSRLHNFGDLYAGNLSVAFNHYGLKDHWDLSSAVAVEGGFWRNFDVTEILGPDSTFSLNYGLDAEYSFYDTTLHNAINASYQPLVVGHRQIHSGTAHAGKELGDFNLSGYAGYAYDLYGGHGPLFGGTVGYEALDQLVFELRASRGVLPEQSQETVDEVGLNVKWKFM